MLGHKSCTSAEDRPREQGADKGVSESDPSRGETEVPAELSRIADKDHSGKVGGTEGEGGQPRADASATEDEAVDISRMTAAINADTDHKTEKAYEKNCCENDCGCCHCFCFLSGLEFCAEDG